MGYVYVFPGRFPGGKNPQAQKNKKNNWKFLTNQMIKPFG